MSQCLPPYFYAIFTPLSVRVSEDLATAYQLFFTSLYLVDLTLDSKETPLFTTQSVRSGGVPRAHIPS